MGNSSGSYSEPGTRNNYQAETSPMVRDDDDVTHELRRRQGEGVGSHNITSFVAALSFYTYNVFLKPSIITVTERAPC